MGRKIKIGLDYFPMDVDFFDDIKVRKLIKHKGSVSILVYSYLLSLIYKEGYFLKWDEDIPFIIYEKIGQDESYIKDVINYLIDIEMFSKYMFEKENILTSKGIQKRYKKICDTLKRRDSIDVYNLINTEKIEINTEEIAIDTEETNKINTETEINSVESATKERNGMEENENKEKENNNKEEIKKEDEIPIDEKQFNYLEYHTYYDLVEHAKKEESWFNSLLRLLKLEKETILSELENFPVVQEAKGNKVTNLKDFKNHFFNYMNLRKDDLRKVERKKSEISIVDRLEIERQKYFEILKKQQNGNSKSTAV